MPNTQILEILHSSQYSDQAVRRAALTEALNQIDSLDLSGAELRVSDITLLAKVLKTNETLTDLNLAACGRWQMGEFPMVALAEALKVNKTLTSLDLSWNHMGSALMGGSHRQSENVKSLAEALKVNNTLTELDLDSNNLGSDVVLLAKALETNQTLSNLKLKRNLIDSQGACAIAEALKTNKALTVLDLSTNDEIDTAAAEALVNSLKTNRTLKDLNLYSTNIGRVGKILLIHALFGNHSITRLVR